MSVPRREVLGRAGHVHENGHWQSEAAAPLLTKRHLFGRPNIKKDGTPGKVLAGSSQMGRRSVPLSQKCTQEGNNLCFFFFGGFSHWQMRDRIACLLVAYLCGSSEVFAPSSEPAM